MRRRTIKPADNNTQAILKVADELWERFLDDGTGEVLQGTHDATQDLFVMLRQASDRLYAESMTSPRSHQQGAFNAVVVIATLAKVFHDKAHGKLMDEGLNELIESSSLGSPTAKHIREMGDEIVQRMKERREDL